MKKARLVMSMILLLCLLTSCGKDDSKKYPTEYKTSPSPTMAQMHLPSSPGKKVAVDETGTVQIDYSNASQGYVQAKLLKKPSKRMRLQIKKDGKGNIAYDFTKIKEYETFPLELGSGSYEIKVLENRSQDIYTITLTLPLSVKLVNEQITFLYPNQTVNFNKDSKAIQKAFALTKKDDTVLKRIATLYNYVVDNTSYDRKKAKEVDDIYVLPIIDETLKTKKGICFDYAALLAAMLRSQQIPTRLVTGNTTVEYHAWIEVYIEGKGWINPDVLLKAKKWSRMDPTFASAGTEYEDGYEDKYYY